MEALREFRAPLAKVSTEDFATSDVVFQIGVAPVRIDVLTSIDGVEFAEAWAERVATEFGGVPVHVLSMRTLIKNKTASGRLQDLADVEALRKLDRDS